MNQAKEFLEYIFNAIKIWVIILPWQNGLRVRGGKKVTLLTPGLYFRIPYFDTLFVQETRLRVCDIPIQTVTTLDLKTVTLKSSIGYSIVDIEKLYSTLYHPETSILNIAMSEVADMILNITANDVNTNDIEANVLEVLNGKAYGLSFEYFKITSFAIVRTYRLIQDNSYSWEGLKMDEKK